MAVGMIADGVTVPKNQINQLGICSGLLADDEEGGPQSVFPQECEEQGGRGRRGAVIDGEGDSIAFRPPVADHRQEK